ncbi:MAG: hypothetical protein WC688_04360 [Parachlamydiales bacterium]
MPLMLLSKIIGIYFIISSMAFLLNPSFSKKIFRDLSKSYGLCSVYGSSGIVTGVSIIFSNNLCFSCFNIILSAIGWGLLTIGLVLIFFPRSISRLEKKYKNKRSYLWINLILLTTGIFLTISSFL